MSALKDLMLDVYHGRVDVNELSAEEQEAVLDGFLQVAEELAKMAETAEVGQAMIAAIQEADEDPFEDAINEAEARGSTYWELETNSIH